eukprot:gnl/TRDRNA2_/TRDRNA2_45112_c0_seq1.p1 gnl/TRDRNA2_/TRDRNA2_45112_c0~~gnl/TRDRNA2_/TRDRNA2_45112_c0_seq1.p1  ORF type:complete len:404 (+),score=71.97 gnl/TRDRNA2_/TRDRNA2_45112_c0_seq1:67-1278(+)
MGTQASSCSPPSHCAPAVDSCEAALDVAAVASGGCTGSSKKCFDPCGLAQRRIESTVVLGVTPPPVPLSRADGRPEVNGNCADAREERRNGRACAEERKRRPGLATESMDSSKVRNYVKPVYPKGLATKDYIRSVLTKNAKMQVLVGHLSLQAMDDVVNAFQFREVCRGQDVIKQGEEGDCLYVCSQGSLDIFVAKGGKLMNGDKGTKVLTVGPGSLFGELALIDQAPRAATVTVVSRKAKLWSLDREPFRMLLAQRGQQEYELYESWLAEVPILQGLSHNELARISELMERQLFDEDEDIVRQGESGERFYILEDGECAAYVADRGKERMIKKYTACGDYFGELALLDDEPRRATVRAGSGGCSVAYLGKTDFTRVLGNIEDLLRERATKYPQLSKFLSRSI